MYKFRSMEKYTADKSLEDLWNVELKKLFLLKHWLALETGNSRRAFSSKDQSAHSLCPRSMSAVTADMHRSSTESLDPAERGSDKWSQPGRGYLSLTAYPG